jgi:predicted nucleic acid-binding protein
MGRFAKKQLPDTPSAIAVRHVIDTNVLIAASAADQGHPSSVDATPADPVLRLQIWQWLADFSDSNSHLVLDDTGAIAQEYQHQLDYNDFGIQVLMHKWSTGAVDLVEVIFDADGNAVLPPELMEVVHDVADRKFVAAALRAEQTLGVTPIVFAGDTDWHDWETVLQATGIHLQPLIEHWSRACHLARSKQDNHNRHRHE